MKLTRLTPALALVAMFAGNAAFACGEVLTQPAVFGGCGSCAAPVLTQPAIAERACNSCTPMDQPTIIDNACGSCGLMAAPACSSCGVLEQPALIAAPAQPALIGPMILQGTNPFDICVFPAPALSQSAVITAPVAEPACQPAVRTTTTTTRRVIRRSVRRVYARPCVRVHHAARHCFRRVRRHIHHCQPILK